MNLSNVLITCASHQAPTRHCHQFLMALREAGAVVQLCGATHDVSLTRNLQAMLARDAMLERADLEWMFWVDHDISSSVDSLPLLIEVAKALETPDHIPTVSGSYVNRHYRDGRSELAAFALNGATEVEVPIKTEPEVKLKCYPALTGMGAMLQHRTTFLAHCVESPTFAYQQDTQQVPEVCQANLMQSIALSHWVDVDPKSTQLIRVAEDFDFCMREFDQGRLVILAPVAFGHEKTVQLMPDGRTTFPGLLPPK